MRKSERKKVRSWEVEKVGAAFSRENNDRSADLQSSILACPGWVNSIRHRTYDCGFRIADCGLKEKVIVHNILGE